MNRTKKYLSTGKTMLLQGLLFATLFSCQKEGIESPALPESQVQASDPTGTISASAVSANMVYEENFEGSSPFGSYVSKQFATSYGFTTSSNPLFDGKKVGRIELRDSDPMSHDGTRAEVSFPQQSNLHRWYSFAAYFPSAQWKVDDADEVLCQWHQGGGYSPSISLRGKNDHLWLYVKPTPSTTEKIDLVAIPKDKWNQIVFHIKHSSGSDGILEVYLNGTRIYNKVGVTMYDLAKYSANPPKWKLGIYKSNWNDSKTTKSNIRVMYIDNVRIGNEKASYAEMTAKGSGSSTTTPAPAPTPTPTPTPSPTPTPTPTPTPAPTPAPTTQTPVPAPTSPSTSSPITSFTLVSAHTEKDIMTISNGASISIAAIKKQTGAYKVNIRANTNSSTVKSVKFELTGAQSRTYSDKQAPFALYDNGGTNYYYGNWNPPALGTYTLKATPYATTDGSGAAGVASTIKFTFVK